MNKLAFLLAIWSGIVTAASLENFTPQGEQGEVRQAQARFSAAMAPLGRSDAAAPFQVECEAPGNGHWVDERTWVYDFEREPQAGASCRFLPRAALAALNGEAVTLAAEYGFSIAGPRVRWSLPHDSQTVDEDQVFLLLLNGAAMPESVLAHARCEIQGIHEQVPVMRLTGGERTRLLAQLKPQLDDMNVAWEGGSAATDPRLEVLRCARTLPANARLALVWGQGVSMASGQRNPADQRFVYSVRDHFSARMRCQRENARAGCMPLTAINLDFTAPVARALLNRVTLKDAKGTSYRQARSEPAVASDDGLLFPGPFAANSELTLELPVDLVDDKGRELVNAARYPLRFKVAEHPPLLKFSGDFGILERAAGGLLPLTARNLEAGAGENTAAKVRWVRVLDDAAILDWRARVKKIDNPPYDPQTNRRPETRHAQLLGSWEAGVVERALPKPNGARAFEVVAVPLEQPGFYVVEAESRRLGNSLLGQNVPMYVRTTALVTNLGVHFKWGAGSSLVWVTRLDQGTPVADAQVAVRDCKGRELARATSDSQGMALIPRGLPDPRNSEWGCPLMVSARAGDDLSFAFSDWDEGIEIWRFGLPESWDTDKRLAHSVLDRVLFRPGDTVHMKHFLRDRQAFGLSYASQAPRTLMIEHGGSGQRWFLPLAWKNGAAESTWQVPVAAKRGDYRLRLLDKAIKPETDPAELQALGGPSSGAFSVADFRVPLMRASVDPARPDWLASETAEYDLAVGYLNGGGAKGQAVKLRAQLEPRYRIAFPGYDNFDFALRRDTDQGGEEGEVVALAAHGLKLDAGGAARAGVNDIPKLAMPHNLRVELEYADPNGEIQTVSRVTPWWPAKVVLGLKNDTWARVGKSHTLVFQALDPRGRVAAKAPVEIRLSLRQTFAYRERLAGGFYGYRSETRVTPLAESCAGMTDAKGRFSCTVRAEQSGEIMVSATARDAEGRLASTHHSYWVAGKDEWVFAQQNHDRIDLIPERKHYEPGQIARFQVRMPFRTATALVTVEREGVLDARVVTLSGKTPVLEIPVKSTWAPNIFVSALVLRGRNDDLKPTALLDLGRPAFKLGIAGIEVGRREHQLKVEVQTDRASYQVREKARVKVKVRTPDGKAPPAGTEVTLAAVDEGLLELAPNESWKLLEAMMAERGYAVHTFTAQMQITGKRHYGKKALPAGGGGGKLPTRELFDTLLFWRGGLALDANGEASIEVPLNDSLTAFRIVAIAAAETRFGTGHTAIRSTQDLQLISGLPPVLRAGDRLQAHVTVRNGGERWMQVEVSGAVHGDSADRASGIRPTPQTVRLAAGESRELAWPMQVPERVNRLDWTFTASEVGGKARDALKLSQSVEAAVPVRVQSSALYRVENKLELPVAAPVDALPGSGELRATLAASLLDGQTQLRTYMRGYPYTCLEQKVSKAVATRDNAAWRALLADLPTYQAQDGQMSGLLNFFPGAGEGSVALTAYVLSIADEAGWQLPVEARARMENALADYLAGKLEIRRADWEDASAGPVSRLAALEALSRYGRATPALIATIKPEPRLWASSAVIDWIGVLKRTPALARRDDLLKDAYAALDSRFTWTGRRLDFNSEARDGLWWMMSTADGNAVRALLAVVDEPAWKARLPRFVAGVLARQRDGRWNSTPANAWGSLALERYRDRFETVKPTGKTHAALGKEGRLIDWAALPRGATAFLPLSTSSETLYLKHEGQGEPYASVTTLAAVPLREPLARGYGISRELLAIERKIPDKWSRGDVVRVRLTIDARDDMGWVVLEDPIPAGASILSASGRRGSTLLTQAEGGNATPAWRERLFDRYRAYYDWLPRGRHLTEYTLRLNSEGAFNLPPTRVEAMYAPELYGEAPNGMFEIGK
ncbi:MAG: MG2 domain-containing protein [Pseudomonadota bacterium]|nr:MG2 domain-containing protein [Pseudomonadota bacterium]MDP1905174.1 MG2 domain-containing protein [Pseudomonadota bacterium]MDP2351275.1 MG2 domain-containing protein [Pseudomonadota bacterium]